MQCHGKGCERLTWGDRPACDAARQGAVQAMHRTPECGPGGRFYAGPGGSAAAIGRHRDDAAVGRLQPGAGLQPLGLGGLGPTQCTQVRQALARVGAVQWQRAGHAAHQGARLCIALAAGRQLFHQRHPGRGACGPGRAHGWQQAELHAEVAAPCRPGAHPQRQAGPRRHAGTPQLLRRRGRGRGRAGALQAVACIVQCSGGQRRVGAGRGDPVEPPAGLGGRLGTGPAAGAIGSDEGFRQRRARPRTGRTGRRAAGQRSQQAGS